MSKSILVILTLIILSVCLQAQGPVTYTRPSQLAKVFQRIGTTDIELVYHAPLAKGRKVFGELVPYHDKMHGKRHPWRAGANENTTITFSHDVMINGKPLKAGTYGLHIFVDETAWEVTFSTASKDWGSFAYTADNDALRVPVQPQEVLYQDWLSYQFINPKAHRVTIQLHWANQLMAFDVSTNVEANIIADVAQMESPNWSAFLDAAKSTLNLNPQALAEGMELIDKSIAHTANLANRMFKAGLLEKTGKTKEADRLRATATKEANANELFSLAMAYNNEKEDTKAEEVLARNMKENPEHWMAHLGYANYYRTHKDQRALEYYRKAIEFAPETAKGFANYQYGYAKRALGVD